MAYTLVGDNKINSAVQIGVSETGNVAATIDGGETWKEAAASVETPTSQGNTIKITIANTFVIGNIVYKTSDGWGLAKADADATSEVAGIVTAASETEFTVTTSGLATITSHGVAIGSIIYLSQETAGAFTSTEYASGISVPLGVIIDSDTILMDIKRAINILDDNLANTVNLISTNLTIYVATTGNDTTGNGTSTNPFLTISKAIDYLQKFRLLSNVSVTVQVADGTYYVASEIVWRHLDASRIMLQGNTSNAAAVKLYKTGGVGPIIGCYAGTLRMRYLDFEGDGNKTLHDGYTNIGIMVQSNSYVDVQNCIINNFDNPGLYITGNSKGFVATTTISNCFTGMYSNIASFVWSSTMTYIANTANTLPAVNTVGNGNSYIYV